MWKRIELHNHTIESDGGMTAAELVDYLEGQGIDAFSLTDHNTISGFPKVEEKLASHSSRVEFIKGVELTSYYGHLLCQNVSNYIPWDDIDEMNGDLLFLRVHEAGGLAGPAHPFSIPSPFSNGMRWSMKIHDLELIDFIEVVNNAHPMDPDNQEAILWWEDLIFSGFNICPVSGMDLHRPIPMEGFFSTYICVKEEYSSLPLSIKLDRAIRTCSACVTKGPVLDWELTQGGLKIFIEGSPVHLESSYLCQLRTREDTLTFSLKKEYLLKDVPESILSCGAATLMLFEDKTDMSHLTAIARPLLFK
ncbi:CehA/McbA family metallohydrolase [Clostridium boliviensis]|uniref:CehA/McbA family metallohydrolase n=1 Tax=Clostridium boliviensis TaxID=318465 RepID=A0ABU4GQ31_9CLOT|nr:CehA/McbA family metallohydrolase [Clostridium boliviensis]MDW2799724.1 CehA/McbA family metallohydrolase [Clostridium boliviensis]